MSLDFKNLRCRDCTFWWPTAEGAGGEPGRERSIFGQCRRYAIPTAFTELTDHSRRYPVFATTKLCKWCGEHADRAL